jgi:hypothetical protein
MAKIYHRDDGEQRTILDPLLRTVNLQLACTKRGRVLSWPRGTGHGTRHPSHPTTHTILPDVIRGRLGEKQGQLEDGEGEEKGAAGCEEPSYDRTRGEVYCRRSYSRGRFLLSSKRFSSIGKNKMSSSVGQRYVKFANSLV